MGRGWALDNMEFGELTHGAIGRGCPFLGKVTCGSKNSEKSRLEELDGLAQSLVKGKLNSSNCA